VLQADCRVIRRPNDRFFADKFQACIEHCEVGSGMMLIHADCHSEAWGRLVDVCHGTLNSNPFICFWAPRVLGTPYDVQKTEISSLPNTPISVVAQTDAIVFALAAQVTDRMRRVDYSVSRYGWGLDWIFCAHTMSIGKCLVVDRSCLVKHAVGSGYSRDEALQEMKVLLDSMTPVEKIQFHLLNCWLRRR